MRWLKDQIPRKWRLAAQLLKRQVRDQQAEREGLFATATDQHPSYSYVIEQQQSIRPGKHLANKLHNLRLGSTAINPILIQPGQMFSFWRSIGAPTLDRGFLASRNLVQGKLVPEVGGGLCQLSGILYLLALRAGIEIIERHHHSVDIYAESERFCPLGTDATVVYGYKDLRLKNNLATPLAFQLTVSNKKLTAKLVATSILTDYPLDFVRKQEGEKTVVDTVRKEGNQNKVIATSYYL
ncbi:MAG: VanW family protein [Lewinella sp.]|jgi:vancomycin resistance protein VanW|uniref:VanW family protein n=1 Tax=Lewinella sp. TaxID=2004506 RepID=UPI003D6B1347